MMKLLLYLEETFSIQAAYEELMPETFTAIDTLSSWVENKIG